MPPTAKIPNLSAGYSKFKIYGGEGVSSPAVTQCARSLYNGIQVDKKLRLCTPTPRIPNLVVTFSPEGDALSLPPQNYPIKLAVNRNSEHFGYDTDPSLPSPELQTATNTGQY